MSSEEILLKFISDKFDRNQLIYMLLLLKFEQNGIRLNSKQRLELKRQISNQVAQIDDNQLVLDIKLDYGVDEDQVINNLNITLEDIEIVEKKIGDDVKSMIYQILNISSKDLLREWKKQATELLGESKRNHKSFNKKLLSIWKKPLYLFDMLIGISSESGSEFNNLNRLEASQNNDFVFEVLTRLHARGCQIAREIHMLLSNGFADGAHARWRTLHEISVIANFINQHGQNVAERYLLHTGIETYKAALDYQKHYQMLGLSQISETEMQDIEEHYDELIKKFGNDFKNDYGWASIIFGRPKPTFYDIEQSVDLGYLRPFVKMAHANIHASAKGIAHRLGLLPEMDILLVGSSIYGLGDPGRNSAFSLLVLTAILLLSKPDLENLVSIKAMNQLYDDIYHHFCLAEVKAIEQNS